jgi:hypothetical protein
MRRQDVGDGLSVPELLVDPEAEKGGDLPVVVGGGEQHVPEIAHGVKLDVVHVPQTAEYVRLQGLVGEDGRQVEAHRTVLRHHGPAGRARSGLR